MAIRPLDDRIVVKAVEAEEKTPDSSMLEEVRKRLFPDAP